MFKWTAPLLECFMSLCSFLISDAGVFYCVLFNVLSPAVIISNNNNNRWLLILLHPCASATARWWVKWQPRCSGRRRHSSSILPPHSIADALSLSLSLPLSVSILDPLPALIWSQDELLRRKATAAARMLWTIIAAVVLAAPRLPPRRISGKLDAASSAADGNPRVSALRLGLHRAAALP